MRLFIGYKAWKEEEYLLNRMTFDDLVKAYITYPAIQIYALILVVALTVGIFTLGSIWLFLGALRWAHYAVPDCLVHHPPVHPAWQLDV